jgi:hypothetical protein
MKITVLALLAASIGMTVLVCPTFSQGICIPFLLRLDPTTHEALQRWADSDMRSLNAQIEFLLRRSLIDAGRLRPAGDKIVVEEEEV